MEIEKNRPSAKILQFPLKARRMTPDRDAGRHQIALAAHVQAESGWYHDAAMEEERRHPH